MHAVVKRQTLLFCDGVPTVGRGLIRVTTEREALRR